MAWDASFITADPGPSGKPRGEEARTRRSRDGDWAKRKKGSVFGYKLHVKSDLDHGLVRDLETTTASVHDSRLDPVGRGGGGLQEQRYFGVEPRGFSVTIRRGVRGHPLTIRDRLRNRRIRRRRVPGERPFAILKRVFRAGHVLVTTLRGSG